VPTDYIPITTVRFGPEVEARVLQVVRCGSVAQGPVVAELEQHFASLTGARHAVAVNNGTTALVLALEALGVGPGDEVVTSAFTFVATVNAILERGATVRFADITPSDFCISPAAVEAELTEKVRAIMPVHLYGQAADGVGFEKLAQAAGAHLVEDAAQAVGATIGGRHVGSFGTGCFSLYATKNVTSAEGGMITTSDDVVADRMRLLRNQGMRARYQYEAAGHNYRLTDLCAALAVPQMEQLAQATAKRAANADALIAGLAGLEGLVLPSVEPDRTHVWHQFTIRLTDTARLDRETFMSRLHEAGIGSGIYYPKACYDYDCYRAHPRVVWTPLVETERAAREVVSLPVHPHLCSSDVDRIVETIWELLS
jgi:perosamine synthetase